MTEFFNARACWCFCSMSGLVGKREGENSYSNKGMWCVPEATWSATSIPSSLLFNLPPLDYYPLPLSAGLLNGPQLLNFMPRGQPSQFNGGYRAQVKRPGSFSSPYGLGEGGTNMNLRVQRSYELASYEGALQIGSISEMSWCIGGNL